MNVQSVSAAGNVNFAGAAVRNQQNVKSHQKLDGYGLSQEASNSLRAQVLYQKPKITPYLEKTNDSKEIINALKDKNKMGRSFWGYKKRIANIITKAQDPALAVDNFNILLDAKDDKGSKLKASDISDVLMTASAVNNKTISPEIAAEYGFKGGHLNEKSINSILDKINEQKNLKCLPYFSSKWNSRI